MCVDGEAAKDPLLAEAVRRWGPPIEIRSPDGSRRAAGDDAGRRVCLLLDHQLALRQELDPVDAENSVARLEQMIRRALCAKGPLTRRDLRRYVHADRSGLWVFETALSNLMRAGDIRYDRPTRRYTLAPEAAADA